MPTVLQFRRGTTVQNDAFTGSVGEVSIDTDLDTLVVHDGTTAGGHTLVTDTATQTLTNKTLTSPNITSLSLGGRSNHGNRNRIKCSRRHPWDAHSNRIGICGWSYISDTDTVECQTSNHNWCRYNH